MKYSVHAILPDGQELVIRTITNREEAEQIVEILCRVTQELEAAEDFDSRPRREGNTWYVRSRKWQRNGALLCWFEQHEGQMLNYFRRFEEPNPKVGLAVQYELARNPTVVATAYEEGVHMGRATLPIEAWDHLLKTAYLHDVYGLNENEAAELAGIWQDFENVRGTH